MAYNSKKGSQHSGDIQFEGDPNDVQIDFDTDLVSLKTNGQRRLTVSGSFITSSVPISCSVGITASSFVGDGSGLTGLTTPAITTYSSAGLSRVIVGSDVGNTVVGQTGLTYNGSTLTAVGQITASLGITGSSLHTATTVINSTHISSSLNVSGAAFYSNGVLMGAPAISTYNNAADNRVITSVNSNTVQGEVNLTFDGTALSTPTLTSSIGVHVTGSNPKLSIGDAGDATLNGGMLFIRPSDTSNRVLTLMQAREADGRRICFGVSGSGQVLAGGAHLSGIFNVSGSTSERLISVKSDLHDPVFKLEGTGDLYNSGSVTLKTLAPTIHLSSSVGTIGKAQIGLNSSNNILIQNNTTNKHIVFKANDNGTIKEGLRLDGAIPEVVVNQNGASGDNNTLINFRVESDNNTHMLFVTGSDQVGIGVSDPAPDITLDISGSAIRLRNSNTPANASSPGAQGEIRWDANYIYICVATDTWKRVAIGTW